VAILDDGYQHIQLERDMNILLVDGREGFGTGHVFPLGSLREPLAGLSRADHILITKTERKDRVQDIEKTLRRWNSGAEIFHGRTVPEYLLDPKTGQQNELTSLQGKKIFAFAGLATPEYFFELLRSLGAVLVGEIVFPDHHRYKKDDLDLIRKMIADAEWSVTTEKDMIRLEDLNYEGLPIKVLQIRTEISRQKAFEEALFAGLEIKRIVTSGQSAS
jgi:tetraacyldisaccharide 4'-kinase